MSTLLKRGSKGAAVTDLQRALNGVDSSLRLVVDGDFGPATERAAKAIQQACGLVGDGIVGPATWAALVSLGAKAPTPVATELAIDRTRFFAELRSTRCPMFGKSLSQGQVTAIEGILDGFGVTGDGRVKTLAYGLATARREVGAGMVPVREGFKKTDAEARAYVAKYFGNKGYSKPAGPWGHVYYGRGIVQLTWLDNYTAEGIAEDPDKALEPKFAAELLFKGLIDGRWNGQGKGIDFYLPDAGADDLKNARRTVNITDHWEEIADYYRQFKAAIEASL